MHRSALAALAPATGATQESPPTVHRSASHLLRRLRNPLRRRPAPPARALAAVLACAPLLTAAGVITDPSLTMPASSLTPLALISTQSTLAHAPTHRQREGGGREYRRRERGGGRAAIDRIASRPFFPPPPPPLPPFLLLTAAAQGSAASAPRRLQGT